MLLLVMFRRCCCISGSDTYYGLWIHLARQMQTNGSRLFACRLPISIYQNGSVEEVPQSTFYTPYKSLAVSPVPFVSIPCWLLLCPCASYLELVRGAFGCSGREPLTPQQKTKCRAASSISLEAHHWYSANKVYLADFTQHPVPGTRPKMPGDMPTKAKHWLSKGLPGTWYSLFGRVFDI